MRSRVRSILKPEGFADTAGALTVASNTQSDQIEADQVPSDDDPTAMHSASAQAAESKPNHSDSFDELWRKGNHLLRPQDVDWHCTNDQLNGGSGIVSDLIARSSVSFLIGDSGLGKSPLAYQLGLCVAAGIQFLGKETSKGTVVYADYENAIDEGKVMRDHLVRFLGLSACPSNFLMWTPDHQEQSIVDLEGICEGKPSLLILDSLRSHNPQFERTEYAGEQMKELNSLARRYGVSILAIHHLRKSGENPAPGLDNEDTNLMQWLKQAAGHSSIINQSHTRIAVDSPDGRRNLDAALVLRWHRRVRGESGPLYLERVCDEDSGDAIGYRQLTDAKLLGTKEQRDAFDKLAGKFTFKEAKQLYGHGDDPTSKWLQKCISLGLVRKTSRGRYERAHTSNQPMEVHSGPAET